MLINDAQRESRRVVSTPIQGEPSSPRSSRRSCRASRCSVVISLQNLDREDAFIETDVRLLTTLAASLSVALENRGVRRDASRAAELAIINDVGQALSGGWRSIRCMNELVGTRRR